MQEIILEVKNIHKTYKVKSKLPVKALQDINFEIKQGEFTAIVGSSGSGKSTLLNIIGGLDYPNKGKIVIKGRDITKLKENKLIDFRLYNIGFVFQAYNLLPVLSAEENVAFIMQLQGKPKKEIRERVKYLLDILGLSAEAKRRPQELSGGQQQRVAVARALASYPQFVLADEATANLDSKSTENLLDIMLKLNEEENITFLFSTHDPKVMKRAKRIISLEDGKIM